MTARGQAALARLALYERQGLLDSELPCAHCGEHVPELVEICPECKRRAADEEVICPICEGQGCFAEALGADGVRERTQRRMTCGGHGTIEPPFAGDREQVERGRQIRILSEVAHAA